MPLHPGDILENWEIVANIGEGGMGSVFKARNRVIRDVYAAVKVVHPTDFKQARERFEREIKALLKLHHPSVVRIQGFGQDPDRGLLWFAMDLVEGQPLEDLMEAGPMDVREALSMYIALTEGLAHAHKRGVSHRDLKPANVIIQPDGSPILVDFGISVAAGEGKLTKTGMVVGTPQYLPPEALDGRLDDPDRGDLYAIGQMFVESLDGEPAFPFDEDLTSTQNALRIMHRKVQRGPMTPTVAVPESLRELLSYTTNPEPAHRVPTALELAQRMRAIASELGMDGKWGGPTLAPIATPPAGTKASSTMALDTGDAIDLVPPAPPPKKRRRGGALLAGSALLIVMLIALLIGVSAVAAGLAWVAFMPVDKEGLPTEITVNTPPDDPPDGDIVDQDVPPDADVEPTTTTTTLAANTNQAQTATVSTPARGTTSGNIADKPDGNIADKPDGDIVDEPDGDIVDEPDGDIVDEPDGDIVDEPDGSPDGDIVDEPDAVPDTKTITKPPSDQAVVAVSTPAIPPDNPKSVVKINPRWRTPFGIEKGTSDADLERKLGAGSGSNNVYCKGGEAGRSYKENSIMVCRGLVGGARRVHIGQRANQYKSSLPKEPKLRLLGMTPKQVVALVGPPDAVVNGKMRYDYGNVLLDVRSGKVQGILIRL